MAGYGIKGLDSDVNTAMSEGSGASSQSSDDPGLFYRGVKPGDDLSFAGR